MEEEGEIVVEDNANTNNDFKVGVNLYSVPLCWRSQPVLRTSILIRNVRRGTKEGNNVEILGGAEKWNRSEEVKNSDYTLVTRNFARFYFRTKLCTNIKPSEICGFRSLNRSMELFLFIYFLGQSTFTFLFACRCRWK